VGSAENRYATTLRAVGGEPTFQKLSWRLWAMPGAMGLVNPCKEHPGWQHPGRWPNSARDIPAAAWLPIAGSHTRKGQPGAGLTSQPGGESSRAVKNTWSLRGGRWAGGRKAI
jgi:hypothetical protein